MMDRAISGYIRTLALSDDDYADVMEKLEKIRFKTDNKDNEEDYYRELYYRVDLFLLKYYSSYSKSADIKFREKAKLKTRYLFDRLVKAYPEHHYSQDIVELNLIFDLPPGYILKNLFEALILSGYPHQVLAFCYRSLADNWTIERIVSEFSEEKLDHAYNIFVNEYSAQSALPVFLISLYFLKLQNKLNQKLKYIISNNDSVTKLKLENYMDMITGLTRFDYYYSNSSYHDISEWCNKVKRKVIKNLVEILDK